MNRAQLPFAATFVVTLLTLAGCQPLDPANLDAEFSRESVLIAPGSELEVSIRGVAAPDALRLRGPRAVVDYSLDRHIRDYTVARLRGVAPGTLDLELLDGGELRDVLPVEVVPFGELGLVPGQNAFPDSFPAVAPPFAVVTGHRALVSAVAYAADGRQLDAAAELDGALVSDDASVEIEASRELAVVRAATAGAHALTFTSDVADLPLALEAVAPESVVALVIDALLLDDGGASFSVVGLTAGGVRVIGLEPTLTVADQARPSTVGDWLFETSTVPTTGTVHASWGELSAVW